jgi:hypothetical protein
VGSMSWLGRNKLTASGKQLPTSSIPINKNLVFAADFTAD